MTTANDIIKIAQGELGVKESPANSNMQKYGKEYGANGTAWCCQFVWWVFKHAGASELFYGGKKTAYCPTLMNYYKKQGQFFTKDFKAGDIIFFDFNANKQPDHVGIVERVSGGTVYTIEGNTSTSNDANGGKVMRRTRTKSTILGVGRPNYTEDIYSNSINVCTWQKAAIADGFKFPKYGADGIWGAECEAVAKKAICKQRLTYKYKNLTKIVQRIVGAEVDGKFGSATKKAVQVWQREQGLTADGEVGLNTWRAMLRE